MAVYYGMDELPVFHHPVLTIGSFDGLHFGHQKILQEVVNAARKHQGESVLITFDPHPRKIIHPDVRLGLLSENELKFRLIEQAGIDHVVVVPFSRDFSMLGAEAYVSGFLIGKFHPSRIIIGYDHHFGHDREGDIHLLRKMVPENVVVEEMPAQLIEDAAVSSTKIRKALVAGNVKEAAEMLGRFYSLGATVVHGNKLGGKIGYPTANLMVNDPDVLIPGIGVYAVRLEWKGQMYEGMMSIGLRPTVMENGALTLEVNVFDFKEDLYGEEVRVYFVDYLRGEEKFDSLEKLIGQLGQDERDARRILQDL